MADLAVTLRRRLIPDEQSALLDDVSKLIVVPAGPLWYMPFELLPTGDKSSAKLGERLSVQYARQLASQFTRPHTPPVTSQSVLSRRSSLLREMATRTVRW